MDECAPLQVGLLPLVGVSALRVACTDQMIHLDIDVSLAAGAYTRSDFSST